MKLMRVIAVLLCGMLLTTSISCEKQGDVNDTTAEDSAPAYAPSEDTTEDPPQTADITDNDSTAAETEPVDSPSIDPVTDTPTEDVTDTEPVTAPSNSDTSALPEVGTEPVITYPVTTAPVTEPPVTAPPVTTEPAVTEPTVTEPVTTAPPPAPKEQTKRPSVKGVYNCAPDRVIIYGTCETGSVITSRVRSGRWETNKSGNGYFYIEHYIASGSENVRLYATAPEKTSSETVFTSISYNGSVKQSVFTAKNSRLIYDPTEPFIMGQLRADQNMLNYVKTYLTQLRTEICNATGKDTKIIYVICPNPGTVYSDQMPDYITAYTGGKKMTTPAWQFVELMKDVEGFIVPDLYTMYDKYKDEDIFYRTDTHWSELGAYYACQELMGLVKKDFPAVPVYSIGDFNTVYEDQPAGDMAPMIGAGNMKERKPILYPKFSAVGDYYTAHRNGGFGAFPQEAALPGEGLPSCYFMSDSYGANFLPFAGMYFGKMYSNKNGVLWTYNIDFGLLAEKKPDYVMYIYTDRNISVGFEQLFFR